MIHKLRSTIETYSFGVCSYIAAKIGLHSSRVRLYFIYLSFITMGSPIVLYLILAFWLNIKKYIRRGTNLILD